MAKLTLANEPTFFSWHEFLGQRDEAKIGHNTYVERSQHEGEEAIAIRLHATQIVKFVSGGAIVLNSGGYETVTTKDRLNSVLRPKFRVFQRDHKWFVKHVRSGNVFDFFDGIVVREESNSPTGRSEHPERDTDMIEHTVKISIEIVTEAVDDDDAIEEAIERLQDPNWWAEADRDEIFVVEKDDPVIESPSGWSFRASQENGDQVDCFSCGNPVDDDSPLANDSEGYVYHEDCLLKDQQEEWAEQNRNASDPVDLATAERILSEREDS